MKQKAWMANTKGMDVTLSRGSLHRLDDMMGIVGCGFGTYTRQYE
jgi:hypothetical protein